MAKRYYTTDKKGQEVEVDQALARKLVKMGKKTPDDFTIEDSVKPAQPSRTPYSTPKVLQPDEVTQYRQKRFQAEPLWKQALLGVGSTSLKTLGALASPFSSPGQKQELGRLQDIYEQSSEGNLPAKASEFGADIGYTLVPANIAGKIGKLRKIPGLLKTMFTGFGAGMGSAGVHQLQNLGQGESFDPYAATTEAIGSAVIPGAGAKAGQLLKKGAPGMLRQAVKPSRALMDKTNPPNFVKPLEDKLITRFGGLEEGVENTTNAVKKLATKRDDLINRENISVNITDVNRKVAKKLNGMVKNAEIDLGDAEGALSHSKKAIQSAKKMSGTKQPGKVSLSGEQAVKIRKLADKNSKFNPFKGAAQNPDKVVFNEAYRRVLEDTIEQNLAKKSGLSVMAEYKALKKGMADLIPFQKAGQFRLGQMGNNYSFSLMDMGALGVGGSLGGLPLAAGVGTLRRLTQTPGGARMLFDVGENLQSPSNLKSIGMQTGRSLYDDYMKSRQYNQ